MAGGGAAGDDQAGGVGIPDLRRFVLDDVHDLVDQEADGLFAACEDEQRPGRLVGPGLDGPRIDVDHGHQPAAVLDDRTALDRLDLMRQQLLDPGNARQGHRTRRGIAGVEGQERGPLH